ncbi:L-type lectin-domain containing receptor kinase IX.1-like [Cornus florida]|uniref:L-type lectin-domain containing receptor kinase IX.1-like n=1 Tax=Cornus florida TaxID=4283 RepID=UPI00289D1B88|nr:L-type lectin-domain containing receptor kinase IX.1-like [Cornus florida]
MVVSETYLFNINIFLCLILPFVAPLSFNFNSFTTNDLNIHYEKAYAANNVIQLTKNQLGEDTLASIGRATYAKPLHLWDKASRNLTDFTTNFTFVINSLNVAGRSDGLAFFLAPAGTKIPDNATDGGGLGLTNDFQILNSSDNPFVAVEFDIYQNQWDPAHEHVGIDINSMKSVTNMSWWGISTNINEGNINGASISYSSASKNLTVVFTGFRNRSNDHPFEEMLQYTVDLRDYLPEWVIFGFSAATGNKSAIHTINSWNFSSTDFNPYRKSSKSQTGFVVGLAIGGGVLIGILSVVLFIFWKKKRGVQNEDDHVLDVSMVDKFERGAGPRKFSYKDLARATNDFAQEEKLGEGGFGGVYRGFLRDLNSYVAVKRVSRGSKQGLKEYTSEVMIISRLRHRNLVQLIGWCHERGDLLLVYELMPNGSLDSHLYKEETMLAWAVRYKIAQGVASALLYLHEEWEQCVLHRDIKPSNIMLDSNFNAKLGDFGLARLVDHEKGSQTTVLAGTIGYMDPECISSCKASKETDVYSFGVVALEIACGRKPINIKAKEGRISIIELVWELYGMGKLLEAADPKLFADFDEQEMERLMMVGLWCAHPDNKSRPSIRQAIQVLNFEAPLPSLPSKKPVPTYGMFPTSSASLSSVATVSESSQMSSIMTPSPDTSSAVASSSASLLNTR